MPRNYYRPTAVCIAHLLSRTRPAANGCKVWQGPLEKNGYAKASVRNKWDYAHRHMYRLQYGEIRDDLHVCHKCDVRSCIEPTHLFLGTRVENMQDALRKGRMATGERHHATKLSEKQKRQIIQRARRGDLYEDIARDFGVSESRPAMLARAAGIHRHRSKAL